MTLAVLTQVHTAPTAEGLAAQLAAQLPALSTAGTAKPPARQG